MRRASEKLAWLCAEPRDLVSLWRGATGVLTAAVPHWWTPCWYTLDPASLLVTSHFHEGLDEFPRQWLASEYYDEDVNQIADVMRSPSGIATLHEATGGRPNCRTRAGIRAGCRHRSSPLPPGRCGWRRTRITPVTSRWSGC